VGGSTNVSVPVTINSSGGDNSQDPKAAKALADKVRGAVYDVINKEQRFGGLLGGGR
jgi:phage-related minor tail protein